MELWHLCLIVATHETSSAMRKASLNFAPGKKWHSKYERNRLKSHVQCASDPSMIRPWPQEWTGQSAARQLKLFCVLSRRTFRNYNISRSGYHSKFHNSSAPATKSECATWMQLYQMLRLARKPAVVLLLYYFLTLLFFDPTSLLLYYSFFCFALQFFWLQSLYFLLRDIVHMSENFQLNFLW